MLSLRAEYLTENLNLQEATGVDEAQWELFQLRHLSDEGKFRIETKSRQIAWSWLVAAEGVADAHLEVQSSAYVSINLDEAKEKIRYARIVHESLEMPGKPSLIRDNELMLEFNNGARLISMPAKPPRGKARFNVYLDEFAHVQHDKQIYTAALPVISRGGRLRIGSSPLGASGTFWEVFTQQLRQYPGYNRVSTPWWEVQAFCANVKEARGTAPTMSTQHRVERFGTETIQALYANMPEEDFQQEYEASFVDESTAWITWEEIKANQDESLTCQLVECRDSQIDKALQAIRWLASQSLEKGYGVGVDVGRTRNTTEIYIGGKSSLESYPLRLAITLANCDFDCQLDVLSATLSELPIIKMLIDQNGIGRNLAENAAKRFRTKAEGVDFMNATKQVWATDLKMLMQQRRIPIPVNRDLAYQIHSIKKHVTASKNNVFDTERNEKHHADKFWALGLMVAALRTEKGHHGIHL